MNSYIEERVLALANFIIEQKSTVRNTAKKYGISKSTVHKDVTKRLMTISYDLANDVRKVLEENKDDRHNRGGNATKIKYLNYRKMEDIKYV